MSVPARFTAVLLAMLAFNSHAELVMYDGTAGTLPASQGWFYLTNPFIGASAAQSVIDGAVQLNTTAVTGDSAGYFSSLHPARTNLDTSAGFRVTFSARLLNENHVTGDRSGFSVIVIASDLTAIEIGFWTNEIWVQNDAPLFTHGESVAFDTTSGTNRYEVEFAGGKYVVRANGLDVLSGPLRNYSSFGAPYNSPNFLFFGDDTSSASALVRVSRFSLALYPAITSFALESGVIGLAVSNLESGAIANLERCPDLASGVWEIAGSLAWTGTITTWSAALETAATNSAYRVAAP